MFQIKITKEQLNKFIYTLNIFKENNNCNDILIKAQIDAIELQIADLKKQLDNYLQNT